jgi:2-polyprenyl-3-methyl-5-hydroxy-6-metoxy-1,4-benzoquinol methylase
MFTRTISPEDLDRLKAEREEADRRYNEILSALDAAKPRLPEIPHPPLVADEERLPALNESWRLLDRGAIADGWRSRLAGLLARVMEPILARQEAFNSLLVDHLNRRVPSDRSVRESMETTLALLAEQLTPQVIFNRYLMELLQRLTPYIDSKDYEFEGLTRRIVEDARESGSLAGLSDELERRLEVLGARERRFDAKVSSLTAAHQDLHATLSILVRATETLKREMARLTPSSAPAAGGDIRRQESVPDGPEPSTKDASAAHAQLAGRDADSYKYVGFEDQFRGDPAAIRARLADYLPLFAGRSDVLDVGCGRGEFLDLLRQHGVSARGLDINHEMVEVCRARGLTAEQGDAVSFLGAAGDEAFGGLFAAQVVEHLPPDYLIRMLELAWLKLRPGSPIVLETINVASWFAFFQSYIRDVTHVRPLHPDTLAYFLRASGFQRVEIRLREPLPPEHRLRYVPGNDELRLAFNVNVDRLNELLFSPLDYAAVGWKA